MSFRSLAGQTFHWLTVIRMAGGIIHGKQPPRVACECQCRCGAIKVVLAKSLVNGTTKSCGCWKKKVDHERFLRHGMAASKAYTHWSAMITRATNENAPVRYHDIGISPELRTFEGFLKEIGEPPSARHSVDRIDNDKGYIVGNIRWATPTVQCRNKSNNRILEFRGENRCAAEWCELLGIPWSRLKMRMKRGWSVEDALTRPLRG